MSETVSAGCRATRVLVRITERVQTSDNANTLNASTHAGGLNLTNGDGECILTCNSNEGKKYAERSGRREDMAGVNIRRRQQKYIPELTGEITVALSVCER